MAKFSKGDDVFVDGLTIHIDHVGAFRYEDQSLGRWFLIDEVDAKGSLVSPAAEQQDDRSTQEDVAAAWKEASRLWQARAEKAERALQSQGVEAWGVYSPSGKMMEAYTVDELAHNAASQYLDVSVRRVRVVPIDEPVSFQCATCGNTVDTANHELGCKAPHSLDEPATPEDTITADINELSGYLDACLDGIGRSDVHSLEWLRDFQSSKSPAAKDPLDVIGEADEAWECLGGNATLSRAEFIESSLREAGLLKGAAE